MGKKTYRSHNVSRMLDDEHIQPMSKSVVLAYLRSNDSASTKTSTRSLSDYLAEGAQSTIIAKLKRAHIMSKSPTYAMGELKGNYEFKPRKEVLNLKLTDTLRNILGITPNIVYQELGQANYYHIAKYVLQESYGYNQITNEVVRESTRVGKSVYLKDILIQLNEDTVEYAEHEQLALLGPSASSGYTPFRLALPSPHTELQITNAVSDSKCTFIFCYADDAENEVTYTTTMDYTAYVSPNAPPAGSIDENTVLGTNPNVIAPTMPATTLDADYVMAYYTYIRDDQEYGEYFTYRLGSNLIAALEGILEVKDRFGMYPPRLYARMAGQKYSKKYTKDDPEFKSMKKYAKLLGIRWEEWVEELHESMSGLEYVREIYLTVAAEANSKNPIIHQYLYHYFETAFRGLPNIRASGNYGEGTWYRKDLLIPTTAKKGASITLQDNIHKSGIKFSAIEKAVRNGKLTDVGKYGSTFTRGKHTYYYQNTENTYTAIDVYNLSSSAVMDNAHRLSVASDSEDLVVPIDLAIKANLTTVELERLYTMSLQLVVNTSQTVKKKWYETGVFKFIMAVVGIAIGVFFPPAGVAAYGAMAVVLVAVGMTVAISIAITLLQKLVISLGLGNTFFQAIMVILAVVAAVYGGYLNVTNTTGVVGMTASNVMLVSNAAFAMANAGNQVALAKAMSQYQQSVLDLQARDQSLKEKVEALGLLQVPTPEIMIFLPPVSLDIRLGEEPEDYYEKSIHNVNVGTYVYDYIESYVDINTLLPDLNQLTINLENARYVV